VRARLQDQHQNYRSLLDVVKTTYKRERIYGFYKGLIPCLLRVTPAASLTFIVYENMLELLKGFWVSTIIFLLHILILKIKNLLLCLFGLS